MTVVFNRHLTFSASPSAEVKDLDCKYDYLRENVAFKIDCLKSVVNDFFRLLTQSILKR